MRIRDEQYDVGALLGDTSFTLTVPYNGPTVAGERFEKMTGERGDNGRSVLQTKLESLALLIGMLPAILSVSMINDRVLYIYNQTFEGYKRIPAIHDSYYYAISCLHS